MRTAEHPPQRRKRVTNNSIKESLNFEFHSLH
jgi:hypothetical protein